MASWTNATTGVEEAPGPGLLRPQVTARAAALRRSFPVADVLEPYVERYWSVRWDRTGRSPFRSEVLSHPAVNLSVEAGTAPRFGAALPEVLLHGVVTRRFDVDLVGSGRVVAVKFRPGGFAAMTGRPAPRDSVRPVDPATWAALHADGGRGRLLTALADGTDDDVAGLLDQLLADGAGPPPADYDHLRALLDRMVADRALVRVEQVAGEAGTGVRSLQRLFARYVGVGPKAVLARYRLHDAVGLVDRAARAGDDVDLAGLAASLGWFDHAHFCRDFRDVVGTTPSAYLARARQDAAAPG